MAQAELAFEPAITLATDESPTGVALGDLDRDGDADLVVVNWDAGTIGVRFNRTVAGAATIELSEPVTIAAGREPRAVTVADYDQDGWNDLAVLDRAGNKLLFLFNRPADEGGRHFLRGSMLDVGKGPISLDSADFDGDGRIDVAVALRDGDEAVVLRNTGTEAGTAPVFVEVLRVAARNVPRHLRVADVNRDGRPDLLVANRESDSVSVILNDTPGVGRTRFRQAINVAAGDGAIAVLAEDLNHDGLIDLVTANWHGNDLSVRLGIPPEGDDEVRFGEIRSVGVGRSPRHVLAHDLNGDGRKDLIAANRDSGNVSVVLNTTPQAATTPRFAKAMQLKVGAGSFFIAAADLNLDGAPDIVSADIDGGTVSVLRQHSRPRAAEALMFANAFEGSAAGATALQTADFNDDGIVDVVVADAALQRVTLWLGNSVTQGGSGFALHASLSLAGRPEAVVVADFDRDGRPDFAVAQSGPDSVLLYLNRPQAAGPAFEAHSHGLAAAPSSLLAADLDADGRSDLLVVENAAQRVVLLQNLGARAEVPPQLAEADSLDLPFVPAAVELVDLDRDGLEELAVIDSGAALLWLFPSQSRLAGSPHFGEGVSMPAGLRPTAIAAGDFDLDGRSDLAVTDAGASSLIVLPNPVLIAADVASVPPAMTLACVPAPQLRRADVNADGRADLLAICSDTGSLLLLQNAGVNSAGAIGFLESARHNAGSSLLALAPADLDFDGQLELLALADPGTLRVLSSGAKSLPEGEVPPLAGSGGGVLTSLSFVVLAAMAAGRRRRRGRYGQV
ncbi:MAG TPA: VCBS repeat-containing protein [Solimonas sp.]|nr:VCBS repeat-containing protein [Solimonas sp.]